MPQRKRGRAGGEGTGSMSGYSERNEHPAKYREAVSGAGGSLGLRQLRKQS